MKNLHNSLKLCFVTNIQSANLHHYGLLIQKAVQGGATMIQLREKSSNLYDIKHKALFLRKILTPLRIPLIINDHVEIAAAINADGVHLGQSDIHPSTARKILGPNKIIGLSIETIDQLLLANQNPHLDYVTASAIYPSKTRPNSKTLWGIHGLQQLASRSLHPITAIGGIKHHNVLDIMKFTTIHGVAVIGAIQDHPDTLATTLALRSLIDQSLSQRNQPAKLSPIPPI